MLEQIFKNIGFEPTRGSSVNWKKFRRGDQKVLFHANSTGFYYEIKTGNKKHINSSGLLSQKIEIDDSKIKPLPQIEPDRAYLEAFYLKNTSEYFCKNGGYLQSRGISSSVQNKFKIRQNKHSVIFKFFKYQNKKLQLQCLLSHFDLKKTKYNLKQCFRGSKFGSFSLFSNAKKISEIEHIYVFEGSIDALSFYNIYSQKLDLQKFALVSSGGFVSNSFLNNLYLFKRDVEGVYEAEISMYACFDNDTAGVSFAEGFKKCFTNTVDLVPKLKEKNVKDWNELLNK